MGCVTIRRQRGYWRDMMRSYEIRIDERVVGKIARGENFSFELDEGPHSIRIAIDWCTSPTIIVDGKDEQSLVCKPGGNALLAGFDVLFRRGQYISLQRMA